MTEAQREACLQFAVQRIPEGELFSAFGGDFSQTPNDTIRLLEQARDDRSANDVEFALGLIFRFQPSADYVPLLWELLLADFHTRHEDIALALEDLKDPRSIGALYLAAHAHFAHLDYDENFALPRKCTWALARIGTPEAFDRLRQLVESPNPKISAFAQKRLQTPP